MSKLDDLYEFVSHGATKSFEEDGYLVPVWILENNDARIVVMTPIESDDEKEIALAAVKEIMKKHGVIRYVVALESWFVSRPNLNDERKPSECDDRMEAVIITGEERDTDNKLFVMRKIDRSGEKPILLAADKLDRPIEWGRFTNMFDKLRTKH